VPHPFLSDEWMVAARAVYDEHAADAADFPHKVRINLVATDVPFGEGRVRAYIDSSEGQLRMDLGELDKPDTTITTDYATARQAFVLQDQQAVMQAFMAGKVKIQGDMTKLMLLQSVQPDERARVVADKLKAITA
jgi:SCP-2 sterol transfer family